MGNIFTYRLTTLVSVFLVFGALWFSRYFNFLLEDFSDGRSYKGPSIVFQLISLIIYLLSFVYLLNKREFIKRVFVLNPIPVLLCLLCFVSTLWSLDPNVTLRRSFAFAGMLFFVLTACYHAHLINSHKTVMSALLIGMFSSYFCVVFIPSVGISDGANIPSHYGLWQGVYGFKNALGQTMAVLICLLLPLALISKKHLYLLGLTCIILFMTKSTTPIISLLFSCFSVGLIYLYKFKSKGLFWLVFAFTLALSYTVYANIDYIVYDLIGKDFSGSGRSDIWRQVLNSAEQTALGFGYGGVFWGDNSLAYLTMEDGYITIGHSHNGFVDARLELGYLGLVLYILAILVPLSRLILVYKERDVFIEAKILILFFLLIYTISGSSFMRPNTLLLFIFLYASFHDSPKGSK